MIPIGYFKVKVTWGDNICEKAWGKTVRARIALRKRLHRNPNATELASAIKDKGNDYKDVTPEQVIRAYNRGEEVCLDHLSISFC